MQQTKNANFYGLDKIHIHKVSPLGEILSKPGLKINESLKKAWKSEKSMQSGQHRQRKKIHLCVFNQ